MDVDVAGMGQKVAGLTTIELIVLSATIFWTNICDDFNWWKDGLEFRVIVSDTRRSNGSVMLRRGDLS